jgi:hypothetical protein
MPKIPIPSRYRTLAREIAAMACPLLQQVRPYAALIQAGQVEHADRSYPLMRTHLETCAECKAYYQQLQPLPSAPTATQDAPKKKRRSARAKA